MPSRAKHARAEPDDSAQSSEEEPPASAAAKPQPSVAAAVEAPAQICKEDRIAAAREKYLARKRQKAG